MKKDALTDAPLSQAKFQLCDSKQRCRNDIVSNENGGATLKDLPYDTYTLTEINAPSGY